MPQRRSGATAPILTLWVGGYVRESGNEQTFFIQGFTAPGKLVRERAMCDSGGSSGNRTVLPKGGGEGELAVGGTRATFAFFSDATGFRQAREDGSFLSLPFVEHLDLLENLLKILKVLHPGGQSPCQAAPKPKGYPLPVACGIGPRASLWPGQASHC